MPVPVLPSPKFQFTIPPGHPVTVTEKVLGLQPVTIIELNGLGTPWQPGGGGGHIFCITVIELEVATHPPQVTTT